MKMHLNDYNLKQFLNLALNINATIVKLFRKIFFYKSECVKSHLVCRRVLLKARYERIVFIKDYFYVIILFLSINTFCICNSRLFLTSIFDLSPFQAYCTFLFFTIKKLLPKFVFTVEQSLL